MDTLDESSAEGARSTRAQRLRFAAIAAVVLVVGVVGTGIGLRLADGDGDDANTAAAGTAAIVLPIAYPVDKKLPELGGTPGPLAAVWLPARAGGGSPEVVGLVAESGEFGTLPLAMSYNHDEAVDTEVPQLSPDGRMIAYKSLVGGLVVHDLVSGEDYSPLSEFETRAGFTWIDATHLFGHVAGGSDVDAWVWEPGAGATAINQLAQDGHLGIYPRGVGKDVRVVIQGGGPRSCSAPTLENNTGPPENQWDVPTLCDVLGIIDTIVLLGHGNSDRLSDDFNDPNDGNATVVAVGLKGLPMTYNGRAVPPVVLSAGAPERVTLATELIGDLLLPGRAGRS